MLRLLRLAPIRNALVLRAMVAWAGIRFFALWLGITQPNPIEKFWIVAVVGAVIYLDARRRQEHLLLGNLGISRPAVLCVALAFPGLMEVLLP
ncbi:MAG: hypothetical protein WEA09_03800 [Gemmatimonadota bacterium]